MNKFYCILLLAALALNSCGNTKTRNKKDLPSEISVKAPEFNADSAYLYTKVQVDFGPRVPGTEAHAACGKYLVKKLKSFGAQVIEQNVELTNYAGKNIPCKNIIGSYDPDNQDRILLCAHWDSRPFSDHDKNKKNWNKPIDAANDGAGGVAALLEIARQIQKKKAGIGIDIIFFDDEDWGIPDFEKKDSSGDDGYCLGAKYWSNNPHVPGYTAQYGILLDMISGYGARFYRETASDNAASGTVDKVWKTAEELGYGQFFINQPGGSIEDDHLPIMQNRNIPCIDIIDFDPNNPQGFPAYWHTQQDNMKSVSKQTMQAVGQTLLQVIYNEK